MTACEGFVAPAGMVVGELDRWLDANIGDIQEPVAIARIAGGMSNLTYSVADSAGREFVLRRPPLGHQDAFAHDVVREARILSSLADASVAVPRVRGTGTCSLDLAPFYVMDLVQGRIIRIENDVAGMTPAARTNLSIDLVDSLAEIHSVDLDAVGLTELRRPGNYVARQIRRLGAQAEKAGYHARLLAEVRTALESAIPEQRLTTLLHGDYRLDNVLVGADDLVAAVLDWELASTGDPRADLGMLLMYWGRSDWPPVPVLTAPTHLPGFLTGDELAARYADVTGTPIDDLDYFVAFSLWRLAVILLGVQRRGETGAYGQDDDPTREVLGNAVPGLLERAHVLLLGFSAEKRPS